MSNYVHKYRIDDGRYWGSTDNPNEPEIYGYTDLEPPNYSIFTEIPVWKGDRWEVRESPDGM